MTRTADSAGTSVALARPMAGSLPGVLRYRGLQFIFALSCSSAGVAGSLVLSQRLFPYAESCSLPWLTAVQNLERKQDLASLTPKGGFVAAQPDKGIGRQVGHPPLRLQILADIADNPASCAADVSHRTAKPWRTIKRELEALHILGLLACKENFPEESERTVWRYSLAETFDRATLKNLSPEK